MSKLNNELANSIATVSEGGIEMIHHKYFVGIWSDHEMVISQANKVYDFKKKRLLKLSRIKISVLIFGCMREPIEFNLFLMLWRIGGSQTKKNIGK